MKDSGIEWIGEIPKEWKVCKLKNVLNGMQDGTHGTYERVVSQYPLLSAKNISDNGIILGSNESSISYEDYQTIISNGYPNYGDIALCCVGTIGRCCLYNEKERYAFQRSVTFLRTNEKILNIFLLFLLRSEMCIAQYFLYSKSSAQSGIYMGDLAKLKLLLPPFSEQQRIATFLDEKCKDIDTLITLQEEMITELQAYKQSVISETVTKGLNPNVTMKDSGVEWIGKIPKDWEILPIKFIFLNLDYLREPISAEQRSRKNPQYDYYGASGVIDKIDYYNVDDKVLLIGEDGANLLMRNLPLIYRAEGKFWVNNHAHILKPIKDDYDYLSYIMEAADYTTSITGSAQPKLSQSKLRNIKLCVPPLIQQRQIADYLDTKCAQIDELIALKQQKITSLQDYKKSLIYEYVTGKKEVPDNN